MKDITEKHPNANNWHYLCEISRFYNTDAYKIFYLLKFMNI